MSLVELTAEVAPKVGLDHLSRIDARLDVLQLLEELSLCLDDLREIEFVVRMTLHGTPSSNDENVRTIGLRVTS